MITREGEIENPAEWRSRRELSEMLSVIMTTTTSSNTRRTKKKLPSGRVHFDFLHTVGKLFESWNTFTSWNTRALAHLQFDDLET